MGLHAGRCGVKIIVTGGAGFIGSHVVDRYIELGHRVAVIDDLSCGSKEFINSKAEFYEADITGNEVGGVFRAVKPDIVNHHAAQIDVRKSVEDPVFDARVNILGSLNIIKNCMDLGVKKLIFASTGGAIYGEAEDLPVKETHKTQPVSPYGVSKLAVENYLFTMRLDYTVLRYANVYGPRQNPLGEAGVCAIFLEKMQKNEACVLYGHGEPVRDYVYVGDIAEANVSALSKGSRGIYNLGTGTGTSVKELFEMLNYDKKPEYRPLRPGELQRIYLDSSKAERELGWSAKIPLRDGLVRIGVKVQR